MLLGRAGECCAATIVASSLTTLEHVQISVDRRCRVGKHQRSAQQATHLVCVGPDRDAECAGQAKVGQLQVIVLLVDEQVLWLQVAVQDAVRVTVCNAL